MAWALLFSPGRRRNLSASSPWNRSGLRLVERLEQFPNPAHRPEFDVSHPDPPLNGLRLPFNGLWRVRAAVRDTDTGPAIPEGEDAASGGAPAGLWSASV